MSKSLVGLSVHLLPRGALAETFGLLLAQGLLKVYEGAVESSKEEPSQSQALQLMFDIRFILRLLVWPLSASKNYSYAGNGEQVTFFCKPP